MQYISTRGEAPTLEFDDVLLAGLASDGGLYLPKSWPRFKAADIREMQGL
ncbi:MAG: threonine synthase, partial [Pseudomonadota bacterium]|nr:threonine synthase [Pseudomonadota bacterium]